MRVGAPWRDVPECYGPWQTVYGLFRRRQRAGAWQRIITGLPSRSDAAGLITWDVRADSTIARHINTPPGPARSPSCRRKGRVGRGRAGRSCSRLVAGWLDQKLHLAGEQGRKPLSMLLTGGQCHDSPQFIRVLARIRVPRPDGGRPRTRPDRVLADKAVQLPRQP